MKNFIVYYINETGDPKKQLFPGFHEDDAAKFIQQFWGRVVVGVYEENSPQPADELNYLWD